MPALRLARARRDELDSADPTGAVSTVVRNALHLNESELDALRDLQAGSSTLDSTDRAWAALSAAGLLELKGRVFRDWSLTMRGRLYRSD
jgi:hypothetical protein